MRIIHFIINGHPTSGLAINRCARDTFSDQIRFLKSNLFSDAPKNVLTGVNALTNSRNKTRGLFCFPGFLPNNLQNRSPAL